MSCRTICSAGDWVLLRGQPTCHVLGDDGAGRGGVHSEDDGGARGERHGHVGGELAGEVGGECYREYPGEHHRDGASFAPVVNSPTRCRTRTLRRRRPP